jgi:hypothetical protein
MRVNGDGIGGFNDGEESGQGGKKERIEFRRSGEVCGSVRSSGVLMPGGNQVPNVPVHQAALDLFGFIIKSV